MARLLLLGCSLFAPGLSQHAWYSFDASQTELFENFTSYLQWTQSQRGDVYLGTQFYLGCSAGYFGGQLHADGTGTILFSLWNANAAMKNTHVVSPWCGSFGGEGAGTHCALDYVFEFGLEYRFTLTKALNESGTLWSASVTKMDFRPVPTFLGTIFVDVTDLPHTVEECSVIMPTAVSFQEYYLGGNFYSAANWRGPFMNHNPLYQSSGIAPVDASGDCGNASTNSNVSSSVPLGPSGPPNAFFQQGDRTVHGCEQNMWTHSRPSTFAGSVPPPGGHILAPHPPGPIHRYPTAVGPTGRAPRPLWFDTDVSV